VRQANDGLIVSEESASAPPHEATTQSAVCRLLDGLCPRCNTRHVAHLPSGAIFEGTSNMHFLSSPDLKPTPIQSPTAERRTPAVLARKPTTRQRLMRAQVMLILLGGACAAFVASWAAAH
jgi:hypothetical protein